MKTQSEKMRELGKIGLAKRYFERYETLVDLSKFYGKEHQNEFIKWPTKYLKKLLVYVNFVKANG